MENMLKKIEAERDRLQAELKTLTEAISTKQACEDLVRYVERSPEPFSITDGNKENIWTNNNSHGNMCCSIM